MNNDKEMSEEDKVTHAEDLKKKAEGNEVKSEKVSNSEEPDQTVNPENSEPIIERSSETVNSEKENIAVDEIDGDITSDRAIVEELKNEKVESSVEIQQETVVENSGKDQQENPESKSAEEIVEPTSESSSEQTEVESPVEGAKHENELETQSKGADLTIETVDKKSADSDESDSELEHEIEDHIDYSNFSKKQLLSSLKEILSTGDFLKDDGSINEIKNHFDEIFNQEKEDALNDFVKNGGVADDFEYRPSDEDKAIFIALNELRDRKSDFFREQEKKKEKNLFAKNQILDRLRDLVDGEETTHSINTIKQIQDEWKSIGPVPGSQNRNLWASFNALMDRFYDNRSIYFELKELDRKKNLEHKLEICEKAEALFNVPDLKEAIKSLNDLHEEFKHIGPVPRDEQENLWNKFKTASDAVYSRRKEFYESQKGTLKENLDKKVLLIQKLETFKDFKGSKIKEWNSKTKEVLAIQKEWEAIGAVPRENGKEINKQFWGFFKNFFQNKNHFFKELDEIRLNNKIKAEELIEKAISLQESTDWQQTASQMISLQQEWKKIGPTPEKVRDELYQRFKNACDAFFENRRNSTKQVNKEFDENLKIKEAICKKILEGAKAASPTESDLESFIAEFNSVGFVPRKNMKEILAKFNEAVDAYVKKLGIEGTDKEEFLFKLNLNKLQADPNSNRVLNKKEHGIRKQISDLENNITLWKNNLEFFAASKTADKLKDQFDEKIRKAETEVEKLKKRLTIIREF
ncbi:protein of unknown function [Aquiflexum balticum DSM 16537]|uniref:DUF349 domain-containing protein n=1 Tax=Aquiflexum balticum DSM 16537 TaxID=758820 RepID=A0A1W2H8K3_9BACT|nr:DUF349 domain-containing protein [Aquiflexum balticum]SMD45032.1 protein of unknown function [Aquiflexum balticum DSM 16537]